MEPVSATLQTFGIILLVGSWIILLKESFEDDFTWGLATLFVPPLSYFYGIFAWDKAREAIWMAVLGWVLIFLSLG